MTGAAGAKGFRSKVHAAALLLLVSLCPHHGWTATEDGNCGNKTASVDKIVCATPELSKMEHELDELLGEKSAELNSEAATTLNRDQAEWFSSLGLHCANFLLTNLSDSRVASARQCVFEAYKKRHTFLSVLPMDVRPSAPYLLSGFEIAILADGSSRLGYDVHGMRGPMLKTSLNRVFAAIIEANTARVGNTDEFDGLDSFRAAADGLGAPYKIDGERYLFGTSCERRGCTHEVAMIVDLKTGEVILANIKPNRLNIMLKKCTSERLQHYANTTFRDWVDGSSMGMYGKTISPATKHIESDCSGRTTNDL
jgi:hypothetical protein